MLAGYRCANKRLVGKLHGLFYYRIVDNIREILFWLLQYQMYSNYKLLLICSWAWATYTHVNKPIPSQKIQITYNNWAHNWSILTRHLLCHITPIRNSRNSIAKVSEREDQTWSDVWWLADVFNLSLIFSISSYGCVIPDAICTFF